MLMKMLKKILIPLAVMMTPATAFATMANPAMATAEPVATQAGATAGEAATDTAAYTPMAAELGVGTSQPGGIDFPEQYSDTGVVAKSIHNDLLMPIIVAISLLVLGLLLFVMARFRKGANPVPSKTSHNTTIEIIWTALPIVILLIIAVPSLDLVAKQYKPAPANAVTIKATGYQWYWTYSYPDHGGFEVISNMLKEKDEVNEGERFRTDADGPRLLAADNRMVVPAGVPLRIQTTAADVIHSFAVPSLWFKLDAVPGRLNEKAVTITKPGVYFGQCSELCGARHGFMPIVVEALPPEQFAIWVKEQGGSVPGEAQAATGTASDNATESAAKIAAVVK